MDRLTKRFKDEAKRQEHKKKDEEAEEGRQDIRKIVKKGDR